MKKIICVMAVVLLVASVAYAQKRTPITDKDVAGLKGTYEGMLQFGLTGTDTTGAKLEILNDTLPLKAKLTLTNVPDAVASRIGVMSGQQSFQNDDGTLTTSGTIVWSGAEKNFVEVAKASGKKISVNYFFRGLRGEGTLTKK